MATDPVCLKPLNPHTAKGGMIWFKGAPFYFCSAGCKDRFEVDPALRLRLQRELRASNERIVGLFHSHPDGAAAPSAHDLACAWEPDLVWLITATGRDAAGPTAAFRT